MVWAYLNSVPLSAAPGYGEVHGLGDGLWVWFAADPERVNQLLDTRLNQSVDLAEQGLALRQVVALMIAHRRPSYYLAVSGRSDLNTLTDSHIRLFYREKMISKSLMDAALNARLQFRDFVRQPAVTRINTNKGLLAARTHLSRQLGVSLYDLDRMDLSASTTLNFELQSEVTRYLQKLANPEYAAQVGILGFRLLAAEKRRMCVTASHCLNERMKVSKCVCKPTTPINRSTLMKAVSWSWALPLSCVY